VGLDGWHLTRAQLDAFPDAKLAHDRRGAHWTFDGESYVEFVRELREPIRCAKSPITAPSFDHALKDPTAHAVEIYPNHRIVVIEGLYTFLSIDPWRRAGEMLDERWFIDVKIEEASRRLVKRHVFTGVARDMDEAHWRARENDMPSKSFDYSVRLRSNMVGNKMGSSS
jgi:pantothenate kinase